MNIFLSWSELKSKRAAEILSDWFSENLQMVNILFSSDIEKGRRWSDTLSGQLENTDIGIICLTKENLNSNWIHYEAGALAKLTEKSLVCTLLLGIKASDVASPLSQFQATQFDKDDFYKLLSNINSKLNNGGTKSLTEKTLRSVFERSWPALKSAMDDVISSSDSKSNIPMRTQAELLEEILERVRNFDYRLPTLPEFLQFWEKQTDIIEHLVEKMRHSTNETKFSIELLEQKIKDVELRNSINDMLPSTNQKRNDTLGKSKGSLPDTI